MTAPNRNITSSQTVLDAPTIPGFSNDRKFAYDFSNSSGFTGIDNQQALEALSTLLYNLQAGNTEGQRQVAERNAEIQRIRALSGDYSKGAAFLDAENLVNQSLRQAMEKNMPVIAKSIQGAGTSASSMQGLLSQRLATESSQAAGALGAQQAVQYGNISSQLAQVLEALTRTNDPATDNILKALELYKTTRNSSQNNSVQSSSGSSQTASGGGSYIANTGSTGSTDSTSFQPGVSYGPSMTGGDYVPIGSANSYYDENGNYRPDSIDTSSVDYGYSPAYLAQAYNSSNNVETQPYKAPYGYASY